MLEAALIALRGVQDATAMILFGSSLALMRALPADAPGPGAARRWPLRLLAWNAAALAAASLLALVVQTSILAGSLSEGIKPESLWAAITTMAFGPSALVRAAAAALAFAVLIVRGPDRRTWRASAAFGAVATASIAWMGHGGSTEGPAGLVHVAADVLHALAAGIWIGALMVFLGLLRQPLGDAEQDRALHRSLHDFGGTGSAVVAVILASGLVNSWFLVGPQHLGGIVTTLWGQLLLAKLALFVAMLGFAALNRFRLTPQLEAALQHDPAAAVSALRRSIGLELAAGLLVLALVAALGMQPPPAAG